MFALLCQPFYNVFNESHRLIEREQLYINVTSQVAHVAIGDITYLGGAVLGYTRLLPQDAYV